MCSRRLASPGSCCTFQNSGEEPGEALWRSVVRIAEAFLVDTRKSTAQSFAPIPCQKAMQGIVNFVESCFIQNKGMRASALISADEPLHIGRALVLNVIVNIVGKPFDRKERTGLLTVLRNAIGLTRRLSRKRHLTPPILYVLFAREHSGKYRIDNIYAQTNAEKRLPGSKVFGGSSPIALKKDLSAKNAESSSQRLIRTNVVLIAPTNARSVQVEKTHIIGHAKHNGMLALEAPITLIASIRSIFSRGINGVANYVARKHRNICVGLWTNLRLRLTISYQLPGEGNTLIQMFNAPIENVITKRERAFKVNFGWQYKFQYHRLSQKFPVFPETGNGQFSSHTREMKRNY
jgi:hypothetical protein